MPRLLRLGGEKGADVDDDSLSHAPLLRRLNWIIGLAVFALAGTIIGWSLGAVLVASLTHQPLLVESDDCADANQCTIDLKVSIPAIGTGKKQAWCEHQPLSRAATCTSDCHVTGTDTHCDGAGGCESENITACLGYCAPDEFGSLYGSPFFGADNEYFPLRLYYLNPYPQGDNLNNDDFLSYGWCNANELVFTVLQIYDEWWPDTDTVSPKQGSIRPCTALLNDSLINVDGCIVAREYNVDGLFVQNIYNQLYAEQLGDFTQFNGTHAARLCTFRYACSRENTTVFTNWWNLGPLGDAAANGEARDKNTHRPPPPSPLVVPSKRRDTHETDMNLLDTLVALPQAKEQLKRRYLAKKK